jgi:hypothetical protein
MFALFGTAIAYLALAAVALADMHDAYAPYLLSASAL